MFQFAKKIILLSTKRVLRGLSENIDFYCIYFFKSAFKNFCMFFIKRTDFKLNIYLCNNRIIIGVFKRKKFFKHLNTYLLQI